MGRQLKRVLFVIALVLVVGAVANRLLREEADWVGPVPAPSAEQHARGGTVRVAVLSPPEASDQGPGGAALRTLTLPHLFVAQPDGSWRASLVEPGSDRTARDAESSSFRLRSSARWSDGTAITVDDLRRSADPTWVQGLNEDEGLITVRFTHRLPDWRRLWSGSAAITAPRENVSGGPFVVSRVVSGLQTDLEANPSWYAKEGGPFLERVSLVVAADNPLGRQLLATGQVDVFAPQPETNLRAQLGALSGVAVSVDERTLAYTALRFAASVPEAARTHLAVTFPRALFANGLLHDQARAIASITPAVTARPGAGDPSAIRSPTFSFPANVALMTNAQRAATTAWGSGPQLQSQDAPVLNAALDAGSASGFQVINDGAVLCWSCHYAAVDRDLALRADGRDADAARALERKLLTEGYVAPLWRPFAIVAHRTEAIDGVVANGFDASPVWNAERWFVTA